MTPACAAPLSDDVLLGYWAGDGTPDEVATVEEHLFNCSDCTARVEDLALMGRRLTELVLRGRLSGVVSRRLVNTLQRAGVRIRTYTLAPGEVLPCTVFPGDDIVVTTLRADFSTVATVTLTVTGPGGEPMGGFEDVPVAADAGEVLWALPAEVVRHIPTTRATFTLHAADDQRVVLGTYVLEHTGGQDSPL